MQAQRTYVADLRASQAVDQVFVVREKDLRTTKSGELYIAAMLGDKTGSIPARMWQASEAVFGAIPLEGFIHVRGRVEDYRGALQLVIDALRPWPSDKVDLAEFLAVSDHDVEAMWSELLEIMRGIQSRPLKLLIKKFVEDHDLVAAVKKSPAAVQMHHPFVGGLVEHTLNIARDAVALMPFYPQLNADLVLASVFLHDIAKSAELTSGMSIHYTDRGQLVGHITIACIWIEQKAALVAEEIGEPFPQRIIDVLEHIILAHHGQYDFGSPKLPAVPEAFFLHYLDNLDAKMWMTANAIDEVPEKDASFTPYVRALETRLYRHSRDLLGKAEDGTGTGSLFE